MKKETKALIEWIKAQIGVAAKLDDSYLITTNAISTHKNLEKDAVKFLDSLSEIESHLCRGGYIQDKNGTPCCHGDAIKYNSEVYGEQICTLEWDNVKARFFAVYKAGQLQDGSVFKLEQQLEFTTDEIEKYEGTL